MVKKLPRGVLKMNHVHLSNDYHSDCSVYSSGRKADMSDIPQLNNIWETRSLIAVDTNNNTFSQPDQDHEVEEAGSEETTA